MRLIDAEPIIKNLSAMKTQLGYDAIDIDGMIKALREAEEVEAAQTPNDPLNLDHLREMKMFEWVWIEVIHPSKRQVFRKIESAYYQIFEDYTYGEALCCGWPGLIHEFEYEDYGKTWLAYRRKKENK